MPAILAKKLGMTQRFLDDGRVERVTVLEAGPCPVTAIRTHDADGYEAVQLAFGEVSQKALNKPLLGHLKKADAGPLKHVREFRDEAGELQVGEDVKVDVFEKGQRVKELANRRLAAQPLILGFRHEIILLCYLNPIARPGSAGTA